jgi:hypothetical protein
MKQIASLTLTALLLALLAAIPAVFADEMPRIDAAGFGFSPSATPSKNVAALQKALDGGHKVVTITTTNAKMVEAAADTPKRARNSADMHG